MKNIFIVILLFLTFFPTSEKCYAKHQFKESVYQAEWCNLFNGQMEYKLSDKTRVDCLTEDYAVEFDFASKWAEAIGQSLYYGIMTNRKPAVVLIIEKPEDFRYYKRIEKVAQQVHLTLWYIKSPKYNFKH